jgi:hypothetical protein
MKFYFLFLAETLLYGLFELQNQSDDPRDQMYYLPSTFIIPCSIFDILNTSQILYLLRKLAFVI